MKIVDKPCSICPAPEDEVGCVEIDAEGVVACEGCRRQGLALPSAGMLHAMSLRTENV